MLFRSTNPSIRVQSTNETSVYSYSIGANNYSAFKIEAMVQSTNASTTANSVNFAWNLKNGSTILDTYHERVLSTTTAGGASYTNTIATTVAGGAPLNLQVTVQPSAAISTMSAQGLAFRIYGIEDYTFGAGAQGLQGTLGVQGLLGTQGIQGVQGQAGSDRKSTRLNSSH